MHSLSLEKYFVPLSTCPAIKGYARCCVYDLQRCSFSLVPMDIYLLLSKYGGKKVLDISIKKSDNEYIKGLMQFIETNEFAVWVDNSLISSFPPLDTSWHNPSFITNAICYEHFFSSQNLINYFESLICQNIQLVSDHYLSVEIWFERLKQFDKSRVFNIDIQTKYSNNLDIKKLKQNHQNFPRLRVFGQYAAPSYKSERIVNKNIHFIYSDSLSTYINDNEKSTVSPDLFAVNISLYTESQKHHTYFNKKLYIGPNGEIKNAPECPESFGYIQDIKDAEELKSIIATPEFQKYWFVHKETTDVCKDCEFRHMCVDNRLPYQRAENEWYHKAECNYNPYICKWQGEEGYRTLQECGIRSDETGFYIDHDKIAAINRELWGDDE